MIKNVQLFENIEFSLQMQIVNERIIISYNTQKFSITLIDNFKLCKNDRCQFYIIIMQDYNMIFNLFWFINVKN